MSSRFRRLDYVDFGFNEKGTVVDVTETGAVRACTSRSDGMIKVFSPAQIERARLICRIDRSHCPLDASVTPG